MVSEEILMERERIKRLIEVRVEAIKGFNRFPKSSCLKVMKYILFYIDNPDYVRLKDREQKQEPITT
jgi:hypothetical protein